ncbi:hypothetical protein MBLNU230_g1985t1 [Neophaeotheca triangularis]
MAQLNEPPLSLFDLLSNSIILRQTAPYIPPSGLVALSATSKTYRNLLLSQPEAWRYLDLSTVPSAQTNSVPIDVGGISWRNERMDESLTEDDFYSGPLRGIFSRLRKKDLLLNVQTLVLDGLSVPADLVREIVAEERYNVKILSVREAKNLNMSKLMQVLRYLVRPTRPEGTPRLKALYCFGSKDAARKPPAPLPPALPSTGVMSSEGAQIGAEWNHRSAVAMGSTHDEEEEDPWLKATGKMLNRIALGWPETLEACEGLIAFDATLCRGPRHDIAKTSSIEFLQPAIATVALGSIGCEICGASPEGPAVFGNSPESALPLLTPPPTHAATVRAAQRPNTSDNIYPSTYLRCEDCLRGRWCERCNRWWCEDCYKEPKSRVHQFTEMQQVEMRDQLRNQGWTSLNSNGGADGNGAAVKVYSRLCVEHCLVDEMMAGSGSNGMWG